MFISCIKAIQHTKNIYEDSVIVDKGICTQA